MTDTTSDSAALALVPPAAVPAVTDDQAAAQAQQIDPTVKKQIDATVAQYVNSLLSAVTAQSNGSGPSGRATVRRARGHGGAGSSSTRRATRSGCRAA